MAEGYNEASYAVDEKKFPGWIYIIMKVKGLKVKKEGGLFGKKKVAKNAHIEDPAFGERTVTVKVDGKDDLTGTNIELAIKRLPYDILPSSCYIEAEEDRILVYLKKSDSRQSWRTYIEGSGIETDE
ncbi:hypothetical protein SNE40_011334 [Patella caerulea]|uniref:Uncharacterized protein n=1 Tax=Patella caerulea TaxID=87958 RepID=A0AAN8JLD6_PATCE